MNSSEESLWITKLAKIVPLFVYSKETLEEATHNKKVTTHLIIFMNKLGTEATADRRQIKVIPRLVQHFFHLTPLASFWRRIPNNHALLPPCFPLTHTPTWSVDILMASVMPGQACNCCFPSLAVASAQLLPAVLGEKPDAIWSKGRAVKGMENSSISDINLCFHKHLFYLLMSPQAVKCLEASLVRGRTFSQSCQCYSFLSLGISFLPPHPTPLNVHGSHLLKGAAQAQGKIISFVSQIQFLASPTKSEKDACVKL